MLPDVTGLSVGDASDDLRELGLEVVVEEMDCGQNVGTVCSQDPVAGSEFTVGDSVTLFVQKP